MVNEAMLPRTAVREVEQRLTAAGCPDADFDARELFRLATGRDVRLSDRPLTLRNDNGGGGGGGAPPPPRRGGAAAIPLRQLELFRF